MPLPGFGKPGSAFAVTPVSRLSGNLGQPKGRQPASSSPDLEPAAKKQKTQGHSSHFTRTPVKATAEGVDDLSDATSEQRSTTDQGGSQGGILRRESHLHSTGSLEEFHKVEDSPKRRRRGRDTKQTRTSDQEQGLSRSDSGLDELGNNVDYNHFTPRARAFQRGGYKSLGDGADKQFQSQNHFKQERKTTRVIPPDGVDHSPDPLHSDPFHIDTREGKQAKKRPSSSLSSRGDIRPTWAKSRSTEIDALRFRIKSAICQPAFKFWPPKGGEVEFVCTLAPSEDNTRLVVSPVGTSDENDYSWLGIETDKIQRLESSHDSSFLRVIRSANPTMGSGAQLMLQCLNNEVAGSVANWLSHNGKIRHEEPSAAKMQQYWDTLVSDVDRAIETKRNARRTDADLVRETAVVSQTLPARGNQEGISPFKTLRGTPKETMQTYASRARRSEHAGASPYLSRSLRSAPKSPTPVSNPPLPRWSELKENEHWDKDWDMPLVFNRTTVDKIDVPKLDEGECLNDNLISFGLRYLFDRFNNRHKDLNKRAYFLNSFFYEKLKMPGKAKINYDGVKTWTSKVDILSYDYIIVPVNEFHHWWVAIICNPGRLAPDASGHGTTEQTRDAEAAAKQNPDTSNLTRIFTPTASEVVDVEMIDVGAPQPSRSPDGATAAGMSSLSIDSPDEPEEQSQAALRLQDNRAVIDLSSETLAVNDSPGTKQGPKKRGKVGKYDPNNTRIITLDSLGSAHSAACQHLKKYLVAEFKDKRGVEITELPPSVGMTATNIPHQDNFCDCGVYLLGYIREFVKDPDAFINLLLEKKDCNWSWTATELRAELREFILDFQKEYQSEQIKAKKKRAAQKRAKASAEAPTNSKTSGPPTESAAMNSAPSTARSSVAPPAVASRNQSPCEEISIPVAVKATDPAPPPPHPVVDKDQQSALQSSEGRFPGKETLQVGSSELRPLKRTYDEENQLQIHPLAVSRPLFPPSSNEKYVSKNDDDRQLWSSMPSPKRFRLDSAGYSELEDHGAHAAISHRDSPVQAARNEQTSTPTPISQVASPTSGAEAAEVDEQLQGEALQAVEKATADGVSQSSMSDAFKDPSFVEKLPDSSPSRRLSSPFLPSSTLSTCRSPHVNKISVEILQASSSKLRREEFLRYPDGGGDDLHLVDDLQETKGMTWAKDDDVVEISRQKQPTRSRALDPSNKDYSAWSSGSEKIPLVGGTRVLAPSAQGEKYRKSPTNPASKMTMARRAPQQTNPSLAIDLTGED